MFYITSFSGLVYQALLHASFVLQTMEENKEKDVFDLGQFFFFLFT